MTKTYHQINPSTPPSEKPHIAVEDLTLAGGTPDVLEVTVTLGEAVEGVVTLTAGTDEAAESVGLVLTSVTAVLVNLADGQLDGGVVVGLDDAVGGAALARHVAVGWETMLAVWVSLCILRIYHSPLQPCCTLIQVTRNDRNPDARG